MRYPCGRYCVFVLLLFLSAGNLSAQFYNQSPAFLKSNSRWVFGFKGGIDFNSGSPQTFLSALVNNNQFNDIGCQASVSDKETGALLFYTKKRLCWDRNNNLMPNSGNPLTESYDSFRGGSVIVPFINDPNRFYVFSLAYLGYWQNDYTSRLSYSVVDMTLNSGMGDIVPGQKNIELFTGLEGENLSPGIVAVPGNNCDVWFITYSITSSAFRAYHITAAGFDPTPVVSSTAPEITLRPYYFAISPSRTMLAMISGDCLNGCLNLYRFDPETGMLSQRVVIPNNGFNHFMPAFSPDNRKIFTYTQKSPTEYYFEQYNVHQYSQAAVENSMVKLYSSTTLHAGNLKLYGGKLYSIVRFDNDNLGVMDFNASGSQPTGYNVSGVNLFAGSSAGFVLPSEVIYPYKADDTIPNVYLDTNVCFVNMAGGAMALQAKSGFNSYVWNDGTAGVNRTITDTGKYWVRYRGPCNLRVDTFIIRSLEPEFRFYLDTTGCFKNGPDATIDLVAVPGFNNYTWEDGTTGPVRTISGGGVYWVKYNMPCNFRTDTFVVREPESEYQVRLDTIVCKEENESIEDITLHARSGFISYLWNDGFTGQTRTVNREGAYWVHYRDSCAEGVDTFIIHGRLTIDLGNYDTVVCEQRFPFTLSLPVRVDAYRWSDQSSEHYLTVREPGSYWVNLSKDGCNLTDSILVSSKYCPCIPGIPNAFSPNNDGLNDYFQPSIGQGCVAYDYIFRIFNRWGQVVYSSFAEFDAGWDGTIEGRRADAGVYGYEIRFKSAYLEKDYYAKGELILIR